MQPVSIAARQILKKKIIGFLSFLSVAFLMCILKLWFTLLLLLALGLISTAILKKRTYCYFVCPLGNTLDFIYEKNRLPRKKISWVKYAQPAILIGFWFYLVLVLFIYWNQPDGIWIFTLRLMLFTFFSAIVLQYFFGKRFWCVHLCPLGYCMKQVLLKRGH